MSFDLHVCQMSRTLLSRLLVPLAFRILAPVLAHSSVLHQLHSEGLVALLSRVVRVQTDRAEGVVALTSSMQAAHRRGRPCSPHYKQPVLHLGQ